MLYKIRPGLSGDINDLAKIMRSNKELYDPIMPGAFEKYASYFEKNGIPSAYDLEVIEDQGSVIAFIGTIKISKDFIYMLALYLLKDYHRKGIGSQILSQYLLSKKEEGFNQIILLAHKDAYFARKFYEKNGFEYISDQEDYIKSCFNHALSNYYIKHTNLYSKKL